MKKIISTLVAFSLLGMQLFAVPVEIMTDSPSTLLHQSQLLSNIIKSYQQYEQMVAKAQEQVERLNKINEITNKANDIASGAAFTVANPMEVLENLKNTMASIKYNIERLANTVQNIELADRIKSKYIEEKCGLFEELKDGALGLDPDQDTFTRKVVGEENTTDSNLSLILDTFTNVKSAEAQGLGKALTGLPLALVMCNELASYKEKMKSVELDSSAQSALLAGDFKKYEEVQRQKIAHELQVEKVKREEQQRKLTPLFVRMESMQKDLGVRDPSRASAFGQEFCRKTANGKCAPMLSELDYIKAKEADMIQKASNKKPSNSTEAAQSQADREFIMLDYLREIATQLQFLNESTALYHAMVAGEKMRDVEIQDRTMFQQQVDSNREIVLQSKNAYTANTSNVKFDSNGFPIFQ
ncbi:hypothetical protein [uncultured Helicobacter sp.]|uniref:hypothetical protein n=1 Tax=uncultured Helicobacter sp. TaxID=175537 RepID=UPI0037520036